MAGSTCQTKKLTPNFETLAAASNKIVIFGGDSFLSTKTEQTLRRNIRPIFSKHMTVAVTTDPFES